MVGLRRVAYRVACPGGMEGDCVSAVTADPAQTRGKECRNMPGYRYVVLNHFGDRSSGRGEFGG